MGHFTNLCLCCDATLLRHIDHAHTYWYCPHCRQSMPGSAELRTASLRAMTRIGGGLECTVGKVTTVP